MNESERIKAWVHSLTPEEARTLLVEMVDDAINISEQVSFYPDNLAPYWSNSGQPLVPGQKAFRD